MPLHPELTRIPRTSCHAADPLVPPALPGPFEPPIPPDQVAGLTEDPMAAPRPYLVPPTLDPGPFTHLQNHVTLAGSANVRIRTALAHAVPLDPRAAEILGADEHARVRFALASNPSISEDLQRQLSEDRELARALAANPALVPDVALKLLDLPPDRGLPVDPLVPLPPPMRAAFTDVAQALADNPALVLGDHLPVRLLAHSPRTRAYRDEVLAAFDPDVTNALAPNWSGTLGELRAALASFAKE